MLKNHYQQPIKYSLYAYTCFRDSFFLFVDPLIPHLCGWLLVVDIEGSPAVEVAHYLDTCVLYALRHIFCCTCCSFRLEWFVLLILGLLLRIYAKRYCNWYSNAECTVKSDWINWVGNPHKQQTNTSRKQKAITIEHPFFLQLTIFSKLFTVYIQNIAVLCVNLFHPPQPFWYFSIDFMQSTLP